MEFKTVSLTKRIHNRVYDAILPTRPQLSQTGKTVLITGGTGGIAYAIARNFGVANAHNVIITGRTKDNLDSAVEGLAKEVKAINATSQTKFDGRVCQISEPASIDALFHGLSRDGIYVDVLILSAAQVVPGKLTDQTWQGVWDQFIVNVRSIHHFRDLFEGQGPARNGTRYIVNVSTAAIHDFTNGMEMGSYTLTKNSAALLLQKLADETDPSKVQIINFHPGAILSLKAKQYGMTADSANWDDEDLPGSFAVWAASPEAAFLHGRFVWAAWDVNELQNGPLREKIDTDTGFLKIGVHGL
ncbi:Dehydrogenase/reductase SDR family member [Paramyrothecium foliicola]|nr:Dehydrogenase/reductase SDR family member [Paramyrothecium foliicola]